MAEGRFRTDIQGLRAVAVTLVLLYHAGVPFVPGGYIGVDVFFVISGFLITTHLLDSLRVTGRIGFAQFYARRARRILPAAFVVAAVTSVAVVVFYPPLDVPRVLRDALSTVLYVPNVWFAIQNTDYLADHAPSPFQHYWSLGVEEQFYLLWPAVLLVLFLASRRRLLPPLVLVVGLLSLGACILLTARQQPLAFFLLPTRAWELLAGALVAVVPAARLRRLRGPVAAAGGWLGLAMVVLAAYAFGDSTPFPGAAAVLPVVGTALVIACGAAAAHGGPTRALSVRPAQYVGLISYALYLVHWPLIVIPAAAAGVALPVWLRFMLGVVLALPLAALLHRFVECPARAPAILVSRRPAATGISVLAATLVLALSLTAATSWAASRPIAVGSDVVAAPDIPADPPVSPSHLPGNLQPALDSAADDIPVIYPDGCHHDVEQEVVQQCVYGEADGSVRIAIFGDSHAAQWFPAMQQYAGDVGEIALASYTKSSCPAVSVTVLDKNVPYTSCDRWRAAVLAHLTSDPPDLVVISSYAWYPLQGDPAAGERAATWADGLRTTVAALRGAGARVLVLADTPRFQTSPATCVSAHPDALEDCAGVRAEVFDESLSAAEAAATEAAGGDFADLRDLICGPTVCAPVIGDLLVYRDVNHLTATYARYLTPALAPVLDGLLVGGADLPAAEGTGRRT